MSNGPALLAALAASDGVRITSVDPAPGDAYRVAMARVVNGHTAGTATFLYHTGASPWSIGAVLSLQVQAASGADPRFTPHVLADWAAKEYPGGSAEAAGQLHGLLGPGRYELYMETYLDAAHASGTRLAAAVEQQERSETAARARAGAGGGAGCALVLLALPGVTLVATVIAQVRG
ncbi:hypothetical protein ACIRRH_34750 [Kitasatospora sp. NPDC101235]|uniref:hypothetical protein n=1 Tax=Kitasatospora sp. NPDC101235 TaxID=3364101 RepID=UPI00381DC6FB